MAHRYILSRHDAVHDLTSSEMIACHRATSSISRSMYGQVDEITYTCIRRYSALLFNVLCRVGAPDSRKWLLGHNMSNLQIFSVMCGHHSVSTSPLPHHDTSHFSFPSTTCQHHTSGRGHLFIFLASLVPDHGYGMVRLHAYSIP